MTSEYIYVVTEYGCNSSPQSVWTPHSMTFTDYEAAYAYFLRASPPLNDAENKAERRVTERAQYDQEIRDKKEYIIIETRAQIAGYYEGDCLCAKRPYGAVIAASKLAT